MSADFQDELAFEAVNDAVEEGRALILDIDGYEGPLHLLLELARMQKVDLARISILELADQYVDFIKNAENLRIELAADYLVMASWLAYLKSRLILPATEGEEQLPEAEELAAHLAFRLQRLDAMRRASEGLFKLKIIGQSIFVRGAPEGLRSRTSPLYQAEMFDMIKAYGDIRSQVTIRNHKLPEPLVLALVEARQRLARAIGTNTDWLTLDELLPDGSDFDRPLPNKTIRASSLLAGLELAKEGKLEIKQSKAYAPIYMRGKSPETQKEMQKKTKIKKNEETS